MVGVTSGGGYYSGRFPISSGTAYTSLPSTTQASQQSTITPRPWAAPSSPVLSDSVAKDREEKERMVPPTVPPALPLKLRACDRCAAIKQVCDREERAASSSPACSRCSSKSPLSCCWPACFKGRSNLDGAALTVQSLPKGLGLTCAIVRVHKVGTPSICFEVRACADVVGAVAASQWADRQRSCHSHHCHHAHHHHRYRSNGSGHSHSHSDRHHVGSDGCSGLARAA